MGYWYTPSPISTVGSFQEMHWINADTNQRIGSHNVPIWPNPQYGDNLDKYEFPDAEISVVAVFNGTVGSVKFIYNGIEHVENTPPYAMCGKTQIGNDTYDILPCKGLLDAAMTISVQSYSRPNAGWSGTCYQCQYFSTFIRFVGSGEPIPSTYLYNADAYSLIQGKEFRTDLPDPINVTQTPRVRLVVTGTSARNRWSPSRVFITYGSRTVDSPSEGRALFSFRGNSSESDFTLAVGKSDVQVVMYSSI